MKTKIANILALFLALAPFALAEGDGYTIEGDGVLHCYLHAVGAWSMTCDIDLDQHGLLVAPDRPTIVTGESTGLSFTLSWTPVDSAADELNVWIAGNDDCYEQGEPAGCSVSGALGQSPLTVSLDALAASNHSIVASIDPAPSCDYAPAPGNLFYPTSCDVPPAKVIIEQPFHYVWAVAE